MDEQTSWNAGRGRRGVGGPDACDHRGAFPARGCWIGYVRLAWVAVGVWISDGLCAGGCGAAFCTAGAWPALALGNWVERADRAGDDVDRDLRLAVGDRCGSRADPVDLSGVYCSGRSLVWGEAKSSG